jgi:hypothetical protein
MADRFPRYRRSRVFPPDIFGYIMNFKWILVSNIDHIAAGQYQIAVNWKR